MDSITIKVSSKSIQHIANSQVRNQEQIVFKATSGKLVEKSPLATKHNMIKITVLGQLNLLLGDTSAIWRSHQENKSDFDALYDLLKQKPDAEFIAPYHIFG
ncbi:hypothetical protein BCT40_05930 [Vibrio lentus]|uniref:Uncharacterized protein n=1 Tax=Vibrio lentus TaxID=136468 RepID=A0A2N7IIL0_9VIBR|nr:hypothetical protein [Vibrio lentus]PME57245.1 hypothetical protein BCV33_10845 [Vibrio lentus]PMG60805.1 hypothetical protein BCU87_15335 [Vibrio lentus]PML57356.1 hypothetical protein BCT74_19000 [Vibrio lentus]PMM99117.1 hypothetical protein BCT40_05930 [Vibrio lentus]TKF48455.1 hypothetical protein FCV64_03710 [Vibrio lentus]